MAEQSLHGQARRFCLRFGGAVLLALSLGGCELVPTAPVQTASEEPTPQPEERAPREEPVQPIRPATEETRHRVAVLVPISGANAGVGQSIANAANLALLDAGGERIRITVYDTAKSGAAAAANQALAEGNGLFLGPLLAEDVRAVALIAWRAKVPVISFSNDTSVAGDGVYLLGFTPSQSISRVVDYASRQGLERFGALAPTGIYGGRGGEALEQATQRAGARLVGVQSFDRGPASLRTAALRLLAAGPDAVLIADAGRTASAAAPLLKPAGKGPRLLGTELWAAEPDLGQTAALRGAWYASVSDNMFNQLRGRYRARYGSNPYRLSSLGYDAVLLAVRLAKGWKPGRPFPQDDLRDREGFTGIDGAFRFTAGGVAERSLEVREVTATGTTVVSPAARDFD
ncbi:MAG TPA: penicillin-binding protein activator [Allosphingosinicella sp.]|jgi:ABC-type branched-subunit amino acid transport system substrate-binding protein